MLHSPLKCKADDLWVIKDSIFLRFAFSALENFRAKGIEELSTENMFSFGFHMECDSMMNRFQNGNLYFIST